MPHKIDWSIRPARRTHTHPLTHTHNNTTLRVTYATNGCLNDGCIASSVGQRDGGQQQLDQKGYAADAAQRTLTV